MEKRLLLAFVLSFLVLSIWSKLNPPPKRPQKDKASSPANITFLKEQEKSVKEIEPISEEIIETDEEIKSLESDKLRVDFSNIGGSIKQITVKAFDAALPLTKVLNISGFENKEFKLDINRRDRISYKFIDSKYMIKKAYFFVDDFNVQSEIEITNISGMSKLRNFKLDNYVLDINKLDILNLDNSKLDIKKVNARETMLYEYSIAFPNNEVYRKSRASKFNSKENKNYTEPFDWIGFRDRYFCTIIKPDYEADEVIIKAINDKKLMMSTQKNQIKMSPGETIKFSSLIFTGPQDMSLLKNYNQGFERIISFKIGGFFDMMGFGMTDIIAKGMLKYLNLLQRILKNWGVCIIILAMSVYGVTYPLTRKSMSSMKKMQALQPKMAKLKEQHKNNPQKLQKEMMELYKEEKVNPMGGCLPMLLQMPIFIGLYQLLWRSVNFKGAGFLWIKDLSEPDRLFKLPVALPILGEYFNILPILYALLMFVQQKFSSKNMAVADPAQAAQQKMMMTMMPVVIGFVFYNFASGLALYFTVFYSLSTFTQWKMSKQT